MRRWRLAWIILLLLGLAAWLVLGRREDNRRALSLFAQLGTNQTLSPGEADLFRALAMAPPRVREQVVGLAFASTNNAAIALPRLGFLLHCCVEIEPSPGLPDKIWREFAAPALQARPSLEILRLAAATADFLKLGTNAVQPVAGPLLIALPSQPSPATRLALLKELIPLADRMQPSQTRILADAILAALPSETSSEDQETLAGGLLQTIRQFDSPSAQRTISQALDLIEAAKEHPLATLAIGLADFRGRMTPAQLQRLAQALAERWLQRDGTVRPQVPDRLTDLVQSLSPEDAEKVVRLTLAKMQPHSYSIFYQAWTKALAPFLKESAAIMGEARTAAIVSGYTQAVREPWSDILWGRLIGSLLSGRPQHESEPVARQLVETALLLNGQASGWFVERFSAAADHLPAETALRLSDLLLEHLAETRDANEFATTCLVRLAGRLDTPQANQLAQCLLAYIDQERVVEYLALSRTFEPLAAKLDPATARNALSSLFAAMSRGRNPYRLSLLAQRFAPLALHADPAQIHAVIARLLEALDNEKDVDGIVAIAPGLAALAPYMDNAQGFRVGERLIAALAADPRKAFLAGTPIEKLSQQMSPEQSKRAVDLLLTLGLNRGGPDLVWVQKAPALSGSLTPELAESLVGELTARLPRERDPRRIVQHVRAALPFADELRPDQVQRMGDRLLQTVEGGPGNFALARLLVGLVSRGTNSSPRAFIASEESTLDIYALRGVCQALATIFPKMEEPDAAGLAGRLAWRFRQQGWFRPIPYDPQLANALQYAPTTSLTNILRTPFAVGGLRQTALRALELKRDRSAGLAAEF